MSGRNSLKLKITLATIGILLMALVLWQFIMHDLAIGKRSAGTVSLGLIICLLIYGYVYRNFKILRSKSIILIFSGFNVIQTVGLGLIFLIGTIMFTIFRPHFIIPSIGFALIVFAIYYGLNFIAFDYHNNTVDGLFESGKSVRFEDLKIEFQNDKQIGVEALDSGEKIVLRMEGFGASNWNKIMESFNSIRREGVRETNDA